MKERYNELVKAVGNEKDRYQIVDFCQEVVDTLFEGRTR